MNQSSLRTHPLNLPCNVGGRDIPVMVIFHSVNGVMHCDDGFGAAWAFHDFWKTHAPAGQKTVDVEWFAASYTMSPSAQGEMINRAQGRHVYMVDFSLKRPQMLALADSAFSLTVLDHHQSAGKELKNLQAEIRDLVDPNLPCHIEFDMTHSGAWMTWDFLHRHREVFRPMCDAPDMILYIEDGDLWRYALNGSREYQMALRSWPQTFEAWDSIVGKPLDEMIAGGRALRRYFDQQVTNLMRQVEWIELPPLGRIPVVNVPKVFGSEICHRLCKELNHPVSGYYQDFPNCREWGLRSDGTVNVAEIAVLYGGGGHPAASGFRVDKPGVVPTSPTATLAFNRTHAPGLRTPVPVKSLDDACGDGKVE